MNILVIGNGFDLAHGLPTKYRDFLKFVEVIRQVLNAKGKEIDWKDIHLEIKELIKINMKNVRNNIFSQEQIWRELLEENFWIEYFLQCPMYQKENWIDFESEISNVIQSTDFDMKNNNLKLDDDASIVSNFYLEKFFHKRLPAAVLDFGEDTQVITFREMRDVLYQDLNKLTRAFEIYLCEYVGKIQSVKISKEIKSLRIDHVLSFNYSHTYQKLYDKLKKIKYDYIHGESRFNSTLESNNMVLGIDEYLNKKSKDKEIDFIAFKKYYQRIYKKTGSEYKNWVDEIANSRYENEVALRERFPKQIPYKKFNSKHKLYIFGHSLDITDKDVLRDLILNDNVYTTIYYLNKGVMGQQIANLVKVIGQDELIRRTGGSTKTIEFKLQAKLVERKG
ncbi:hypothetical protein DXB43_01405 [Roseburia sp. OM04-10BH]|nr:MULTISPECIES: bacteriophage abortive infection AbiH family protein [unclassified Roseburia]RGI46384.1 hypothetical protein DXB43_01405 [Roseburia sp. OM04-10BH]RHV43662.1 hypothetical protein DXB49_01405 [Roseburia sp. OM04-15AA]